MPQMILLLACLLWAVCRTAPEWLRFYFQMQIVSALFVMIAWKVFGQDSATYAGVWVAMCLCVWVAMAILVINGLKNYPNKIFPCLSGISYAAITLSFASIFRHTGILDWISLTDGAFCVFCGVTIGICAKTLEWRDMWIALTLMLSWLASAIFDFGFSIHMDSWMNLNQWIPTAIAAISTLTLSRLAQRESH